MHTFSGVVNASSCEGYQRRSVFCPISLNKTQRIPAQKVLLKLFRIVKKRDERRRTRAFTSEFCRITWWHFISFFPTDEFKTFLMRLPQNFFLNSSMIQHLWSLDGVFQRRYEQLEGSMRSLYRRAQRVVYKLFSLSKRCQRQPHINLPRERCPPRSHYLLIVAVMNTPTFNSEME